MAHDIFISYSSKDKTIADAVCARLEVRGIRCWIAPRDVHPGLPYGEEIIDAIQSCRVMVLVLSSNANSSAHIPKEIERAVSHGVPIIPLRIENVIPGKSLDYFISSVHWLDAITPPLEHHLEILAHTILAVLAQKGAAPPTPIAAAATASAAPLPLPASQPSSAFPAPGTGSAPAPAPAQRSKKALFALAVVIILACAAWFWWPKGADPIVGCWQWTNNLPVTIRPDGSMTAGPFIGHWRLVDSDHRTYHFTWPEAVDGVFLYPDGRTLQGGNQYGFSVKAARLTSGPGIVGSWRWANGVTVVVRGDGSFSAGTLSGHWRLTDAVRRLYALTWPSPVDDVNLSPDLLRLSGGNQYGIPLSASKSGACN